MPTYDYRCEANGEIVEVRHGMNDSVSTWAQLCELLGQDTGSIPGDSQVTRLATGGNVVSRGSLGDKAPPCATGGGCPGGSCGFGS